MNGQEPAITQRDPRAYYYWLMQNKVPQGQAMQMVDQRFGGGKTPEQRKREEAKASQTSGLAQTGGAVAGLVASRYIWNNADGWIDSLTGAKTTEQVVQNAANQAGQSGAVEAAKAGGATPSDIQSSATQNASNIEPVTEVGSTQMPDGSPGKLMSDGGKVGDNGEIINPDGTSGGSIKGQALGGLQVAGGAAQAYNGYRQYQGGEKLGGAANIAGGAYNVAAGAQTIAGGGTSGSLAGYAPGVGTAVAAAQIGQQMLNEKGSSEDRAAKSQAEAQKAALLWIPGYGWVAYAALAGLDAVSGGKATEALMKYNKFQNKLTDRIDFGLGKNIRSKVFHQSTKGVQEMHTGQLLQQSDDPQWQNYVVGMRAGPKDESRKDIKGFAGGKYATFDEYKKAGLQADDLTGVYGNLDAFKPDYVEKKGLPNWANLSFDQQKAVTQRLIDEDMYSSKKGEVVIADKAKARKIYEEMAANNFGGSAAQSNSFNLNVTKPKKGEIARVSPGMYMDSSGRVGRESAMRRSLEKNMKKEK